MIQVQCGRCNLFLMEPGAILLGPPEPDGRVVKHHLCLECYEETRPKTVRETDERSERAGTPAVRRVPGHHPDDPEAGGGGAPEPGDVHQGEVCDEWRIIASHPASAHPVTLYVTPYEHLATQEWLATERTVRDPGRDSDLHDHRLQIRVGGEWKDVARVA